MEELTRTLEELIGENLIQAVFSSAKNPEKASRVKFRPVLIKNTLKIQKTTCVGAQVFHENLTPEQARAQAALLLGREFGQAFLRTDAVECTVLVSKKGRITVKKKRKAAPKQAPPQHDRTKNHILPEGERVPFLIDLGVMNLEGKVVKARYDKFRQINRYLEFVEDILPRLPQKDVLRIVDFGCGKSYLTFALYYYLTEKAGRRVKITGLDLKADVIEHCGELARRYGFDGLHFEMGDVAGFTDPEPIDMVITLHACDTATDYAIEKAVKWGAEVILTVPCCQHEVNGQIQSGEWQPVLKYGILKERFSALFTDAVRANVLEEQGYEVQILEFVEMEHTPKNLLIRAVKKKGMRPKKAGPSIRDLTERMGVETTLQRVFPGEER